MVPHILHIFPTFTMGGVQLRIADVANRLGDAYAHTALALDGRCEARIRLWPETPFMVEPLTGQPAGLAGLPGLRLRLRSYSVDLICTYNWGSMDWALAAATLSGPPHLHFESGFGPDEAEGPRLRRSLFRRLALRRAQSVVVPSKTLYDLARDRAWVPGRRLRWIVNGVDVTYYRRRNTDGRTTYSPLGVVTVAPLRREKRLDRLIAAAAALEGGAEIWLCGEGAERPALESAARQAECNARVIFLGAQADVRPTLEKAAVFAMTSQTEQMPNALLQAMAMELPVVAFDAGDIRRILPDIQRAFVFAQEDEAGFREGLKALLEDPALRQRLGTANRERVCAQYTMDRMTAAYRGLFDEAIAGGR